MPLTPFMGLSILIHVAIIIGHGIFRYVFPTQIFFANRKQRPVVSYCTSFLVIIFIVGLIVVNGALLVIGSITESHSTVNLATNYYESTMKVQLQGQDAIIELGTLGGGKPYKGNDLSILSLNNAQETLAFFPEIWLRTGHKQEGNIVGKAR